MLTILISILISLAILFVAFRVCSERAVSWLIMLAIFIAGIGLFMGIFCPLSGHTQWEITEEIPLVSLNNSTVGGAEGTVFVSRTADNAYAFRYAIEYADAKTQLFETETVSGLYVSEVVLPSRKRAVFEREDSAATQAILQKFSRKGRMSAWTFALLNKEETWVFNVPQGTIDREMKLK